MIRRFPVSALQKACELQETGIKKLESMGHSVVLFVCQKFNLSDTWLVMDTQTDIGQTVSYTHLTLPTIYSV